MPSHNFSQNQINFRPKLYLSLLVLVSFVAAYLPVWTSLLQTWASSDDYSHGFFIVPIVIYIIWQKKERLLAIPAETSIAGLLLLIISLVAYVLGSYAEIKTVASLSILTTLTGCILFLYGPHILKEVSFPLCFLIFMIPIPGQVYSAITIPLQLIVSKASVDMLAAAGIPILRDGNVIHLPAHTFEVVQACSGLRSLITLLTLATVIAYFTLRFNTLRGILIVSAIPAAILVNIIRVTAMIVVYHLWGYNLTEGAVHTTIGVVIFILAISIIYLFRNLLIPWDKPTC